jgi:hypothetical protein
MPENRENQRTGWRRAAMSLAVALLSAACGAGGSPPRTPDPASTPNTPGGTTLAPTAPAGDPFAVEGTLEEESLPLLKPPVFELSTMPLPPAAKGVPAAPASCGAFAKRKPAGKTAAAACKEPAAAHGPLDAALSEADVARRDALLADLEACAGLPVGLVRALRAELAPTECGDAIVESLAAAPPKTMSGAIYHALFGQVLAARCARTVRSPPQLAAPYDKKRVQEFINGPMAAWISDQARAVQETTEVGAKLPYYGKALVAVEAGMADMRFVEAVRAVPLPVEFAKDAELRDAYYGNLDRSLDPRKDRGRDAALVGLRELAFVGTLRDERVDRARALLSQLYGGRRIDALDVLQVPPLAAAQPATADERLATKLPTFYAGLVLDPQLALSPSGLRALLERGLSVPHRVALKGAAELQPEVRLLYARARLALGQRYWRRVDIEHSASLLLGMPKPRSPEADHLLALTLGLRGGPEDAAQMMRRAPLTSLGMGKTAALDSLAAQSPPGAYAGAAAFDAALIRQVAAPQNADAAYWKDVARRFRAAAQLAKEPAARAAAEERAKAAELTAEAIAK